MARGHTHPDPRRASPGLRPQCCRPHSSHRISQAQIRPNLAPPREATPLRSCRSFKAACPSASQPSPSLPSPPCPTLCHCPCTHAPEGALGEQNLPLSHPLNLIPACPDPGNRLVLQLPVPSTLLWRGLPRVTDLPCPSYIGESW